MTKVDVQKNSTISMTRLAMVLSPYTSLCARCLGHSCKVAERRRQAVFRSAGRAICPGDGTCQREHTYFRSITAVTSVGRAVIKPRPDKWGDECRTSPGWGTIPSYRKPASVSRAECTVGCRYVARSSAPDVPIMVPVAAPGPSCSVWRVGALTPSNIPNKSDVS